MTDKKQVYELCGLKENPLPSKLKRELNPLTREELNFLYAKVEGFGRQVSLIEEWFADAENLDQSNLVLVFGPKGSGRSSVSNYIIWQFCQAREIDRERSLVLNTVVEDEHPFKSVRDLLQELYEYLRRDLGDHFEKDFKTLFDLYNQQIIYSSELHSDKNPYRAIFFECQRILKSQELSSMIFLDKIKNYQQITPTYEVFKESPLIIYTTDIQEVCDRFESKINEGVFNGFVVKLGKVTVEDINNFLSHRWEICSNSNQENPFDKYALEEIFVQDNLYFKKVTNVLTEIFDFHLKKLAEQLKLQEESELSSESLCISHDEMTKVITRMYLEGK